MAVDHVQVEACVRRFREQLEEDKKELQNIQEKVLRLTTALFQKFPDHGVPVHLNSLFAGEEKSFFPFQEDGGRRRRLAQERREEYNAFLRRKEEEEQVGVQRRQAEETPSRSILEAVDYERVLARRKAEEAEFRNLNRAEPSLDKSVSIPVSPVQKHAREEKENNSVIPKGAESFPTNNSTTKRENDTIRPKSSGKRIFHTVIGFSGAERRGGGGDPLRDSCGNLITTRGYVTFPSEQQNTFKNKQVTYREELRRQIEQKQALEAEQRRRLMEEEEAIARRSEEQRLQMQREYEEELRRTHRKSEQRDHERLRKLEEFQMREEAALRQKRSPPLEPRVEAPIVQEVEGGRRSPPIPAVRSKTLLNSTPPPLLLMEVEPENVFSSLSEIRRSLMQEQPKKDFKNSYEVMNRRTVLEEEAE